MVDGNTKVKFTFSIGYAGAEHMDVFSLNELGYSPEQDTDLERFLEEQWREWKNNYIDGTWVILKGAEPNDD